MKRDVQPSARETHDSRHTEVVPTGRRRPEKPSSPATDIETETNHQGENRETEKKEEEKNVRQGGGKNKNAFL